MLLQRKALYNLLQLNLNRIESGEFKVGKLHHWQIANYREKTSEELFHQLHGLGIVLESKDFEVFCKSFESPEEMVEILAKEREPLEKDQIFLILFELWRRYFPEKRTISIFCDELDYQMTAYDLRTPNEIGDALASLQLLLEEQVDRGLEPHLAFQLIQTYCANDIESFLFDYILNDVEEANQQLARDLFDGFQPFVKGKIWFDYLAARIDILDDPEAGYGKLEKVVEQIHDGVNLDLVEEILFFLAHSGNHSLFYTLAKKALPLVHTEEEFQDFLEACYAHYDYLELKQPAFAISLLFHSRTHISPETMLSQEDPGVKEVRSILEQKLHFAKE